MLIDQDHLNIYKNFVILWRHPENDWEKVAFYCHDAMINRNSCHVFCGKIREIVEVIKSDCLPLSIGLSSDFD